MLHFTLSRYFSTNSAQAEREMQESRTVNSDSSHYLSQWHPECWLYLPDNSSPHHKVFIKCCGGDFYQSDILMKVNVPDTLLKYWQFVQGSLLRRASPLSLSTRRSSSSWRNMSGIFHFFLYQMRNTSKFSQSVVRYPNIHNLCLGRSSYWEHIKVMWGNFQNVGQNQYSHIFWWWTQTPYPHTELRYLRYCSVKCQQQ